MNKLFTERHGVPKPRIAEVLDDVTRAALLNLGAGIFVGEQCAYAAKDYNRSSHGFHRPQRPCI